MSHLHITLQLNGHLTARLSGTLVMRPIPFHLGASSPLTLAAHITPLQELHVSEPKSDSFLITRISLRQK